MLAAVAQLLISDVSTCLAGEPQCNNTHGAARVLIILLPKAVRYEYLKPRELEQRTCLLQRDLLRLQNFTQEALSRTPRTRQKIEVSRTCTRTDFGEQEGELVEECLRTTRDEKYTFECDHDG